MSLIVLNSHGQDPAEFENHFGRGLKLPRNAEICLCGVNLNRYNKRSVMWWRGSVKTQSGQYLQNDVYSMTAVSRNLLAFQTLVLRLVVKGSVAVAAERLDRSCGVDPETLDELFKSWQGRKATLEEGAGGNWKVYFEATGCTEEFKAKLNAKGAQAWANYLVKSSSEKVPNTKSVAVAHAAVVVVVVDTAVVATAEDTAMVVLVEKEDGIESREDAHFEKMLS